MKKTLNSNTILIINNEVMGYGDHELGAKLIAVFLKKMWARDDRPSKICFYNSGVKLLVKGSPVLDVLDGLEGLGVDLLACGTCLDHFAITEELMIGHISNMEEIVTQMQLAQKVITI